MRKKIENVNVSTSDKEQSSPTILVWQHYLMHLGNKFPIGILSLILEYKALNHHDIWELLELLEQAPEHTRNNALIRACKDNSIWQSLLQTYFPGFNLDNDGLLTSEPDSSSQKLRHFCQINQLKQTFFDRNEQYFHAFYTLYVSLLQLATPHDSRFQLEAIDVIGDIVPRGLIKDAEFLTELLLWLDDLGEAVWYKELHQSMVNAMMERLSLSKNTLLTFRQEADKLKSAVYVERSINPARMVPGFFSPQYARNRHDVETSPLCCLIA